MGAIPTNVTTKGQLRRRGKPITNVVEHKGGPGGKAFSDSEWVVKINERSVAKAMHLLSDCASYSEWEIEAQRWAMMLYNSPVSLGVDYFVNNLKGGTSRTDVLAGGFLKRKLKSKTDENEEATKKGDVYETIDCAWAFGILRPEYQEPVGRTEFKSRNN